MTGPAERIEGVRFRERLAREMPWGPLFAERRNFEWGCFNLEDHFVEKYLKKPSSVLVFGSGNGREARAIAGAGHRIVCFDIGFLYVKGGSMLCAREELGNIHFLQADMYALPHERDWQRCRAWYTCKKICAASVICLLVVIDGTEDQ